MPIHVIRLTGLNESEAWWAICTVLPKGTTASESLNRARVNINDWSALHHVRYDKDTSRYDVMLLPAMG